MGQQNESTTNKPTFLSRFRDLFNEKGCSQSEFGEAIGVARSTVATWLDGRTAPNAYMVKAMAEYFSVSADYLLCISDTKSSDVNVKAAMEYTGLSEEAVEWLHIGFDHPSPYVIKSSEAEKKKKLQAASDFIKSADFRDILDYMIYFSEVAYFLAFSEALSDQYWDFAPTENQSSFGFSCEEDRNDLITGIINAQERGYLFRNDEIISKVREMSDENLMKLLIEALFNIRDENDLYQFKLSKAFSGYINTCERKYHREIYSRFENKDF